MLSLKNYLTGPRLLPCLPGVDLRLLLLLVEVHLLLLGSLSWLSSPTWPDAIRSLSSTVHLCDSRYTFLPPPTLWEVFCRLSELWFQNNLKNSCHLTSLRASWPDACKRLTRPWPSHFCCWTWWHAPSTGSACFLPILHSSMHSWCILSHLLVFQPSGSRDKRLCSRLRFFCSWFCSSDLFFWTIYWSDTFPFCLKDQIVTF